MLEGLPAAERDIIKSRAIAMLLQGLGGKI